MIPYYYFLKVIICSGILLGYYFLVLRNKVYHQYNRFYLLAAVVCSWLIPLLNFKIPISEPKVAPVVFKVIEYIGEDKQVDFPTTTASFVKTASKTDTYFTFQNISMLIFCSISLLVLLGTIKAFIAIVKLKRKYSVTKYKDYKLYFTNDPSTPFSFFNSIFWNDKIEFDSALGKQIMQHEMVHIQEKHSWDKVLLQINQVIGWFNPMFWIIKTELEMIHEFIADKKTVPNANTEAFATMILSTAFVGNKMPLTNPFFFSPIKRRLRMLTKNKHPKFSYAQRVCALPIVIVLIAALSLQAKKVMANSFKKLSTNLSSVFPEPSLKNEKVIADTVNVYSKNTVLALSNLTGISEAELKEYYALVSKAYIKEKDQYNFELLTPFEKNKLITLAEKLDDRQKLKVPIHVLVMDNKPPFELKKDFNAQWSKWKLNENFTFRIDNKEVTRDEMFKQYDAKFFNSYSVNELVIFSNEPQNNKYEIQLFSNEFYNAIASRPVRKKLVSNTYQLTSTNAANEASETELLEFMRIYNKYSPFKTTTATTLNGITKEEEDKAKLIFSKMSVSQKKNAPILFNNQFANNNTIQQIKTNAPLTASNMQAPSIETYKNWLADSTNKFYVDGKDISRSELAIKNASDFADGRLIKSVSGNKVILLSYDFFEKLGLIKNPKNESQIIFKN